LALASGKLRNRAVGRNPDAAEADLLLEDLIRDSPLRRNVDEAEAVGDLPADEEVPPQPLFLAQRFLLIDGLDAERVSEPDGPLLEADLAIADEQPPRGRPQGSGHDLDQRRLAGAVVAEQAHDLAIPDGEGHVVERHDFAVGHADVL